MTTAYTHTVTIAVPAPLIDDANHLALLLGESSADINSFRNATYTDGVTAWAVAHSSVKSVFLAPKQTGELPPTPPHAEGMLDREAAQRAFDSTAQPGGIMMAVDVDPHEQFKAWGLTRIATEDDL
jgi:hypothetical protein